MRLGSFGNLPTASASGVVSSELSKCTEQSKSSCGPPVVQQVIDVDVVPDTRHLTALPPQSDLRVRTPFVAILPSVYDPRHAIHYARLQAPLPFQGRVIRGVCGAES